MRILLPIARYDYGRPDWGDSFEYLMLVGPLESLGHEVHVFDTMPAGVDRDVLRRSLLATARELQPDLIFTMLFEDELDEPTLRALRALAALGNWFADDAWRFHAFSRRLAPHFDFVVTTSTGAFARYQEMSGVRAIYEPWGFNPELYRPVTRDRSIDVSFVGQRYGRREETIMRLSSDGFPVEVWGGKWPRGRLPAADIAPVFSASKVNLNFSESSAGPLARRGIRFKGWFLLDQLLARVAPGPRQLKARVFEIAACGAFQLTGPAEGLSDFFEIGSEIVLVDSYDELRDAVAFYLEHDAEREAIAQRAYERCATSYSYQTIFADVFEAAGLS